MSTVSASPPSLDAEVSRMNRGRGRQLGVVVVAVVGLVAGGAMLLRHIGQTDAYASAADATAALQHTHVDAFFTCALGERRPADLSAQRVRVAFELMGNVLGKAYAKTLQPCETHLQGLVTTVRELQVPSSAQPLHAALVDASATLLAAFTQYVRYLSTATGDYDHKVAVPMLDELGQATAKYVAAQGMLRRGLEQRF